MNLLDVRNLSIELKTANGSILAVDRVSLCMKEGEVRGLVGESGSGKSLLAQAIMGVLDEKWTVTADRFHWRGQDLLRHDVETRKQIISKDAAMIFQEPMACLDPTTTIGDQLEEAIDEQLCKEADQPTIGILLCKNKDRLVAEYALSDIQKPIGVSEYQLTQSLPENLQSKLPSIEEIENELAGEL